MINADNEKSKVGHVRLKNAGLSDVQGMVSCHLEAFPGQFMAEMGAYWLSGLYTYFIKHRHGISLVAVDGTGNVLGLAVGGEPTIRSEFLAKAVFRYAHILVWRFLSSSIVRKKLLAEAYRRLRVVDRQVGKRNVSSVRRPNVLRSGNLLSIAVFPYCCGTGVAGRLIESFRTAAGEEGYDVLRLSVRNDNLRAIKFYKKHGWHVTGRDDAGTRFQIAVAEE